MPNDQSDRRPIQLMADEGLDVHLDGERSSSK
jgi:hypothetical protein